MALGRLAPAVVVLALLVLLQAVFAGPASGATPPVSEAEAKRTADRDPNAVKERAEHPDATSTARIVDGNWNVGYFADGREVALVIVDSHSGEVRESWTGYQVAWKMARGYSGAFGETLNAPYVVLPLAALFLLGLFDWRRWRRLANLDLVVLLAFGVSHFFFNRAEIGVSVPLAYPVLLYLLGRALWIGFRGVGEGLRPVWPATWLLVAALFLMGFRVGLDVADSGTTDIGYAGVVGADRIAHGEPIYGNFPEDISQGDTYGPVNYLAYVPFERIWPWSGNWDDLPASHAAAITFDLATFALLILLALRIRPGPPGRRLAATPTGEAAAARGAGMERGGALRFPPPEEAAMPHVRSIPAALPAEDPDKSIDLQEPRSVRYWTETLGVSEEQLHTACEHAGASVEEVRRYLGSNS